MMKREEDEPDSEVSEAVDNELLLLQPAVRARPEAVLDFLHPCFREFGASGRAWERAEIVAALSDGPVPEGPSTQGPSTHGQSLARRTTCERCGWALASCW